MAQVIATGKWLKNLKTWSMVVSIRRPGQPDQPKSGHRKPRPVR
jgi:hypothetical protein